MTAISSPIRRTRVSRSMHGSARRRLGIRRAVSLAPFLGLLALLISGCGAAQDVADAVQISRKVKEHVGDGEVDVNFSNGNTLQIEISNSKWSDRPTGERRGQADEIARIAYQNFESRAELSRISVLFQSTSRKLGVVKITSEDEAFEYGSDDFSAW